MEVGIEPKGLLGMYGHYHGNSDQLVFLLKAIPDTNNSNIVTIIVTEGNTYLVSHPPAPLLALPLIVRTAQSSSQKPTQEECV